MKQRSDAVFAGFDESVLERWGLKPNAKDTLNRAQERGAITPQEISEMISTALTKDRKKMSEVLQELKKILQNLNISVTFNVVHTHTHIAQSPTTPVVSAPKPKPQPKVEEQSVTPLATVKGPQYAGEGHESPFLNAKLLREQGLVPEALEILLAAKAKGYILPQQIGTLIPAEISQDSEKLRPVMRWITQLLSGINIKIVIGEVHYKKPESRSPETSYSRRLKEAPNGKGKLNAVLFNSTGLSEGTSDEPSKKALLEIGQDNETEVDNKESGHTDPDEEFIPKFIFDSESGAGNSYYRTVKDHKFLKHQDLLELSRRWKIHGDYEARNTIVAHNLRLSMKIARHYMGRGLDYDDLVQEGNMGLMVAAERFDPEKGFYFTTYATWWVRQHIQRAIQNFKDIIRTPVHATEALNKILKITCELGMELQREPTLEEVAIRADEDVEKVKKILYQLKVPIVSLEELAYGNSYASDNPKTIGDLTMNTCFPSPTTALEAKEDLEIASRNIRTLLAAIKSLPIPEKPKTAFKMYYGLEGHNEGQTLESISETSGFGVTRERIRQMNQQVWKKLEEYGISMNDEKLMAALQRIHDLENIVNTNADLSTPTEVLILDEISIVFQDQANGGEMVPGVIITPRRPQANLKEVKPGNSTSEDIIRVVGDVYGTSPEMILSESQSMEITWARWICIYIMKKELKSSFVEIEKFLHYSERRMVINNYRSINNAIGRDTALGEEIEKIITLCGFRKGQQVDPEEATHAAVLANKAASPIVDQVLTLTSEAFGVEKSMLFAKSVTRPNTEQKNRKFARDVTMYLLRTDVGVQTQEVASIFGFLKCSASNVSIIISNINKLLGTDTNLQAKLALIRGQYSLEVYAGNLEQLKQCQKTLFPKQVEELKDIVDKTVKPFQEGIERLHAKLDALDTPDRYKEILKLRYAGDPTKETLTYEALGQTYDITRERVRQILMTTMEQLTPTLDQSDIQLITDYAQEFEKVRLLVELQNI